MLFSNKEEWELKKLKKELSRQHFTCQKCGFNFTLADVKEYYNDNKYKGAKCPYCGHTLFREEIHT